MKEKLVENWLIKASERSYQTALCSVLGFEGYRVVHSTRHCAMEMGKDIIAIDQSERAVCFQLKALKGKRMTLSEWRGDLQQQIYPLVMGKVVHPATKGNVHRSIVVVTGYLDEEVSNEIDAFNKGQRDAGYPDRTIEVWPLGELTGLFSRHLNKFGPEEPEFVRRWLELFLGGGKGYPDRESFAALISHAVDSAKIDSARKASQLISYLMVLTGSIASQYVEENNHAAEGELWLGILPTILFLQEKYAVEDRLLKRDRAILFDIVRDLLTKLTEEIKVRGRFTEFDEMFDPVEEQFAARTAALIALHIFLEREIGNIGDVELAEKIAILEQAVKKAKLLGEISIVYLLVADLALLKYGREREGAVHVYSILRSLLKANDGGNVTLASPYYDLETIILNLAGRETESNISEDSFERNSYTLRALIFLLVRMNARPLLEECWEEISHFSCSEFQADESTELLLWRSKQGINWTKVFETPQSWASLTREADKLSEGQGLPPALRDQFIETLCFIYAQPFRLTSEVVCRLHRLLALPTSVR